VIYAIASGKGGAGKTTVAASLAHAWEGPRLAVDMDVEEPNLHLFLHPRLDETERAAVEIPVVDETRCTRCRACVELCQFRAIAILGQATMVFPEMCHGCGGCFAVCPESAISAGERDLGVVAGGTFGNAQPYLMGRLRVGEAMSPPLMRVVKDRMAARLTAMGSEADAIVDAPPGVSCPAVTTVIDSDAICLVTEPTPFGFHDFRLAWQAFAPLGKPMGVVVNRAGLGDDAVYGFCRDNSLPILAEIPYSRAVAEAYSRGEVVAALGGEFRTIFEAIRDGLRNLGREAAHA
jgi:MinD superfamily P-loop ATPase